MRQTTVEFLRGLAEQLNGLCDKEIANASVIERLEDIANAMDSDNPTDPLKQWIETMDCFLVDVVRLSKNAHPEVFEARDELIRDLQNALEHVRWEARKAEREHIKKRLVKELR